jgi:Ni2+-binding GTPase involved in maturation of urease and hydrogenase
VEANVTADFLMVGGFLGAGKTTALLQLAEHFTGQGRRVGLISNDQSYGLVDTALLRSQDYPVEEITGGCFCCRFDSLTQAMERLSLQTPSNSAPDVFLAEPVGSCTDLRATVLYPLRRLYGEAYRIAPLSVLVDPRCALRVLGLEADKSFSPKVRYIYRKQLEEADIIVINKCDSLDSARLDRLENALRESCPAAGVLRISAREGTGMGPWLNMLSGEAGSPAPPEVDYDVYAEGEAKLGWLNGAASVVAAQPFDGNLLLVDTARRIRGSLSAESIEIAHLKMTLAPDDAVSQRVSHPSSCPGVVNLVSTERDPELSRSLERRLSRGELLLNLRAEAPPESLRAAVENALAASTAAAGAQAMVRHLECFRPGRPNPTHRVTGV